LAPNFRTWPDADGRKMAIYRPFWEKRIANLTELKFQELKDRQSLRFCGESDILGNNRSVIAHPAGNQLDFIQPRQHR
jgi:hypothetical protein